MARTLGGSARNELRINDNLSGSELVVYYRMPTATERLHYSNKSVVREGGKVVFNHGPVRQEYGMKIFVGFKDGDFADADGNPMSSDPQSPHYNKNWRDLIEKYAADIVEVLALFVFESSVAVKRNPTEKPKPDPEELPGDGEPGQAETPAPDDAAGNSKET
ncbi:MAG: hypothetical protein OEY01_10685 [Desulfobulbaceae bacterium]|nr:hypothetical protein [Desulfobulbaceae bacterium]